MNDAVQALCALLKDPDGRDRYRELASRANALQSELDNLARSTGLDVWQPPQRNCDPRPSVDTILRTRDAAFDGRYRATISLTSVADIYSVVYEARLDNAAPSEVRLEPFLESRSFDPILTSLARVEEVIVPALERAGRRRLRAEDLASYVPGIWSRTSLNVNLVTSDDIHGWLGGEPLTDEPPDYIVPWRAAAHALYGRDARRRIAELAHAHPPWIAEVEAILATSGARIERLSPDVYPSVTWTVDFGEVREGVFRARFATDVTVSKLAPVWYYADRFAMASVHPEATTPELAGSTWGKISYLRSQYDMVQALTNRLAANAFVLIGDAELGHYVQDLPHPIDERVRPLGELLFRDVFGSCPPAPRVEEEGPIRDVRPRVAHLGPIGEEDGDPDREIVDEMAAEMLEVARGIDTSELRLKHGELALDEWNRVVHEVQRRAIEVYAERLETGTRERLTKLRDSLQHEQLAAIKRGLAEDIQASDRIARCTVLARAKALSQIEQRAERPARAVPAPGFPMRLSLAGKRTIVAVLRGTPEGGQYRTEPRGLVTIGPPQRTSHATLSMALGIDCYQVAKLVGISSVTNNGVTYDVMIEDEPIGVPLDASHVDEPLVVAQQLVLLLQRAHAGGFVIGGVRPELVYVDKGALSGVAPRAERFLAGARGARALFDQVYASPEVLRGEQPTRASDVFSTAATIAYVMTGRHPFVGATLDERIAAAMAGTTPLELPEVLRAAFSVKPDERPPPLEIMADLRELAK